MCEGLERAWPTEEPMSSVMEGLLKDNRVESGISMCDILGGVSFIPRATRNQLKVLSKVTMWRDVLLGWFPQMQTWRQEFLGR